MSKVLITSDEYSIYGNESRNLVKTSLGTLVLFYAYGTEGSWRNKLGYKTSLDDGVNWNSVINALSLSEYDAIESFTIFIEDNNDILILYTLHNLTGVPDYLYRFKFVRLTYNSGTWTTEIPVEITSSTHHIVSISMTERSNSDIFIGASDTDLRDLIIYYSSNGGTTWNDISISSTGTLGVVNPSISLIPKGNNIGLITRKWEVGEDYCYLDYLEWDTSWSAPTHIASEYQDYGNVGLHSVVKISDTNIWVVSHEADIGIKVYNYNGSIWDSGTVLFDNNEWYNEAWDNGCVSICNVGGNPVLVCSYIDIDYNINTRYRYYNGSSWETEVILSDSNNSWSCNTLYYDAFALYVCFQDSIYFQKIPIVTPPPEIIETDTITLSDDIIASVSKENTIELETLILSDDVELKLSLEKEFLSESLSLSETIELELQETRDLVNDFHLVKQNIININNHLNICQRVFSNIFNTIMTTKGYILNFTNKINSQRQEFYNFKNDIRTLLSFQIPGEAGVQSLGKSYIKVYINSIEQTDVDIDSISITKSLNTSHTATFELGRPYDSSRPALESQIEIKYHIWTLYKGYITQINPSDSPESIKIQCQDYYWKNNKTKVYFNVGHKPTDNLEVFYNTIASGLSACGISFGIGNFIPQTMGMFGASQSDAISNLVEESGNFAWYYKIDGTPKLWTAGLGDIITLTEQKINTNFGLYQVLNHQIREDIDSIVNKYRVQMGQQVIRRFNNAGGTKQYASYEYQNVQARAEADWDSSYESLADVVQTGYGFDYHMPEDNILYVDVFRKYKLPFLNKQLEEWSDRYDPEVRILLPFGGLWKCSIPITTVGRFGYIESQALRDGFTLDYVNQTLVFNQPVYLYQTDTKGKIISIRSPEVQLYLCKKRYYSDTDNPIQNPTTDISNPLMFFTSKMGTYPETIMENLNLTNLSIQTGGWYKDNENIWRLVPSWNDMEFASDIVNWQLSKYCDIKISGTIDITLDAFCYYGLELANRIMINNILDEPLNIESITLNLSSFTASVQLRKNRYFKRSVSIQSRGE